MATRTKQTNVTFDALKQQYAKARNVTLDTVEGANACKGMRAFIRSNRAALVKAGWKALGDHQKGAAYGDVPANVASIIVTRKLPDAS